MGYYRYKKNDLAKNNSVYIKQPELGSIICIRNHSSEKAKVFRREIHFFRIHWTIPNVLLSKN